MPHDVYSKSVAAMQPVTSDIFSPYLARARDADLWIYAMRSRIWHDMRWCGLICRMGFNLSICEAKLLELTRWLGWGAFFPATSWMNLEAQPELAIAGPSLAIAPTFPPKVARCCSETIWFGAAQRQGKACSRAQVFFGCLESSEARFWEGAMFCRAFWLEVLAAEAQHTRDALSALVSTVKETGCCGAVVLWV